MGQLQQKLSISCVNSTLVLISLAALLFPTQALAQSPSSSNQVANGFLLSPVRSEVTIDKGKSQSLTISIQNPTNIATVAKTVIDDFVASDNENGDPRLILDANTPPPRNDFKTLVSSIPDLPLGPHEKKDVTLSISIPSNANAGGYYGAVRFIPTNNGKQSTVGLTASVGSLVLVTVPGNLVQKLTLVQLSAAQGSQARWILFSGNPSILTRLHNDGDIHVQPFGKVEVKNMFNKVVSSYEFNNTNPRANILPDSTRKFTDSLTKRSWIGRYTISENLAYSQGSGNLLIASATFWYFPAWFIILFLLVIIMIVGLFYWWIWRKRHHKNHSNTSLRS